MAVEELQSKLITHPHVTEVGLQTDEPLEFHKTEVLSVRHHRPVSGGRRFSRERVKSPVHRLRMGSPRTSLSGGDLDMSLENEIRAAGYEIDDSFDSSEGVGFSEITLDDPCHDSTHSLENFKSDLLWKEEERARKGEVRGRKEDERAGKEEERGRKEEERAEERAGKEEGRGEKKDRSGGITNGVVAEGSETENSVIEPQRAVVTEPEATSEVHEFMESGRKSPLEVQALGEHVTEQPVEEGGGISETAAKSFFIVFPRSSKVLCPSSNQPLDHHPPSSIGIRVTPCMHLVGLDKWTIPAEISNFKDCTVVHVHCIPCLRDVIKKYDNHVISKYSANMFA